MTDQSLFEDNQEAPQATPEQQSNPSSTENPFADQLGSIRNERGEPKYSDINTALEALKHSQEYIPKLSQEKQQLEEQLNELRAKLEAADKISDVLKQTPPSEESTPASHSYGEADIEKLLEAKLAQREAALKASSNSSRVNQELQARFGANAKAEVSKKASELGLTASELGEMAQSKPDMVLALFGSGGNVRPTASGVRLPQHTTDANEIKPPEKSLLRGASGQEQAAYMAKIRESIYNQHGITG